jgi:hypothetical protein
MTTEEQRRRVKALAGFGLRQEDICAIIGLRSTKTLRKRFGRELELGVVEARAQVTQAAFKLAASGRDPASTMFWLKSRARWGVKDPESEVRREVFVIGNWKPDPEEREADDTHHTGIIFENARSETGLSGGNEPADEPEEADQDD